MDPIMEIAGRYGLVVIEDAAQAHAAEYRGRRCGSIGDLGCFSFYPGKNLGACGEGGLVTTNNPEFSRKIKILRDWGAEQKYHHEVKGFNYRMDTVKGAVLRVKLRYLELWTTAGRACAAAYQATLADSGLVLPTQQAASRHVFHVYPVLSDNRRELMGLLNQQGVQTGIHYPVPVHLMPAHSDLGHKVGDFPVSERIAKHELSLPIYPELLTEATSFIGALLTSKRERTETETVAA
jgi:dTDP-4-amino-4,6-dideoxygalactose transaminase